MNKTERIFKIEQLIAARRLVSFQALLGELEVSRATLKRDLEYLRSRMKAPIVYDREANGYRMGRKRGETERVEFPGLWFNASEVHALLTMQHMLANLQPGLLQRHIEPLLERLKALLGSADHSAAEIERRVRIIHLGRRAVALKLFETVATALLNRRRLGITYYARGTDTTTERDVSPQRLVYYRESWYLDGWCHLRDGLRSFAVDGIRQAKVLEMPTKDVAAAALDEHFADAYGIFAGRARHTAVLRFTPERARWVAAEEWHPRRKARFEPDGAYVLEVPYGDDRELLMDILKFGPDVEVLAPPAVIPVLAPEERTPGYVLLDDALARKLAHVTEVSESGSVPELLFVNDAEDRVLLIDGEELIGARQNRILNVSILVGGGQKVVIPVSCVEQGRWHYRSRHFESTERTLFASGRAKKTQHVSASLRTSGSRYANQAEIWSDINHKAESLHVHSDTEAMSDIYEQRRNRIEDYVTAFAPQPRQTGAIFAIGGRITGLELFDAAETFRKLMAKLVRSYAVDAIEEPAAESRPPVEEVVRRFLDDMKAAALQRFPSLGEGEDLRFESEAIVGGAIAADDRIVHLCAFRVERSVARPIGRGGHIDFEIPAFLRRPSRV